MTGPPRVLVLYELPPQQDVGSDQKQKPTWPTWRILFPESRCSSNEIARERRPPQPLSRTLMRPFPGRLPQRSVRCFKGEGVSNCCFSKIDSLDVHLSAKICTGLAHGRG